MNSWFLKVFAFCDYTCQLLTWQVSYKDLNNKLTSHLFYSATTRSNSWLKAAKRITANSVNQKHNG